MTSAPARPVIGVTCYVEDVDRPPWVGQRSTVLPHRYVEHLERAENAELHTDLQS